MAMSVEIENYEEVAEQGHVVRIFLDAEDVDMLIASLEAMRDDRPRSNPYTFFSSVWGNGALSTEKRLPNTQITHCLKIFKCER